MRRFGSEVGQTLVEWSLLAALVAVVGIALLGVLNKAVGGVSIEQCRNLACPEGYANKGRTCDDPPVVCGASAP